MVPTKLPFSVLRADRASISTPVPALPEIRLPSGGTTNTGGTVPLVPVGLLAWPVAGSVNAVPPISLPLAPPVSTRPLPPLPRAAVPAGLVPIRLAATVVAREPSSTMPLPRLAEITLATKPGLRDGFSPIRSPPDRAVTSRPSPRLPAGVPRTVRPR